MHCTGREGQDTGFYTHILNTLSFAFVFDLGYHLSMFAKSWEERLNLDPAFDPERPGNAAHHDHADAVKRPDPCRRSDQLDRARVSSAGAARLVRPRTA